MTTHFRLRFRLAEKSGEMHLTYRKGNHTPTTKGKFRHKRKLKKGARLRNHVDPWGTPITAYSPNEPQRG